MLSSGLAWVWGCLLAEPGGGVSFGSWERGRGLTLHGGGAAFNAEKDCHDGVGDAVVEHVALPLELDFAAGAVADRHAAHDEVGRDDLVNGEFFVHVLVVFHLGVAVVGCFVAVGAVLGVRLRLGQLLDAAECALETPFDQVDACCAQLEPLFAGNGGGCETGVLPQVLGGHQRHLEVVLDEHARDELRLLAVVCGRLHGLGNGGEFPDHLGRLVRLEGNAELFAVPRAKDLDLACLARVEGEKLGLEPHHVVHLAMDEDLFMLDRFRDTWRLQRTMHLPPLERKPPR